jgi:GNAT superfamily N-acetyltransferase
MKIEASGVPSSSLIEYARIPIVFEVNAVLDVDERPDGSGFVLAERRVQMSYLKDYDALAETPVEWARRFDTSKWALMIARIDDQCVGGVTVAYDTSGLDMLEGRSDLAVLWDIRVAPARRRHGIGASLFEAAEAWAVTRGCRHLKVETQNINLAACRFYERQGCVLRAARPGVHPECPDEVQLLWYKDLDHRMAAG